MTIICRSREEIRDSLFKGNSSHNIEYMRRIEGDLMFRKMCFQAKASISLEHQITQAQIKASLEKTGSQVAKGLERVNQKEISL